jgi:hypothetical protein
MMSPKLYLKKYNEGGVKFWSNVNRGGSKEKQALHMGFFKLTPDAESNAI